MIELKPENKSNIFSKGIQLLEMKDARLNPIKTILISHIKVSIFEY